MKTIKKTEDVVLDVLTVNKRARQDDFILYGAVLKRLGIDLKNTSLYDFLATAKIKKIPSFETVTRCRRHIAELRPDLVDVATAIKREAREEDFKYYNITSIGD